MPDADDIYRAIGQIYESCLPAFNLWCQERDLRVSPVEVTRRPETENDDIAFLWVFAEFNLGDGMRTQRGKVVVCQCH